MRVSVFYFKWPQIACNAVCKNLSVHFITSNLWNAATAKASASKKDVRSGGKNIIASHVNSISKKRTLIKSVQNKTRI